MSAFNAFFAQLTGGGNSNTSPGSERDSRGGGGAGGAGVVGGGAGGGDGGSSGRRGSGSGSVGGGNRDRGGGGSSSASDVFGVPLKGTVVTYRPETDRRHFGIPQFESVAILPEASMRRGLCGQGALIAANADFVCYSIKTSIRVIHRPTGARALIKMTGVSAGGSPQDMALMSTGDHANGVSGLLACSTSEGDVLVWQLQARVPVTSPSSIGGASAAAAVAAAGAGAVEVSTGGFLCVTGARAQGVKWQPSGYRLLAVICGYTVVICDVTSLNAAAAVTGIGGGVPSISLAGSGERVPRSVCVGHSKQVTDASFSTDGTILATVGEDGIVRLWDTRLTVLRAKPMPKLVSCLCAFRAASEGGALSRVLVVDVGMDRTSGKSQASVVTGDEGNRLLKVWVAPTRFPGSPLSSISGSGEKGGLGTEALLPLQVLSLPGSGALALEADPGGDFLFAADTMEGLLYALHVGNGNHGTRVDYLRPYVLAHPVQSFGVLEQAPEPEYGYDEQDLPSSEGRVLQLICVQTKPVQIYRITARDALPPPGLSLDADMEQDQEKEELEEAGSGGHRGILDMTLSSAKTIGKRDDSVDSESSPLSLNSASVGGIRAGAGRRFGGGDVSDSSAGRGDFKFEKKLDVADEPLGPTALKTTPKAAAVATATAAPTPKAATVVVATSPAKSTGTVGGSSSLKPRLNESPRTRTTSSPPRTPAGDFTATGARAKGVMLGDGAGGGAAAGGTAATAGPAIINKQAGKRRGGSSNSGSGSGGDDVGSGSATSASGSSPQESTPEGWEGAAAHDWDQDSGDHAGAGAVAAASAAAAAAVPTTAGGDSLSETSSSGGGGCGDGPPPPPRRRSSANSIPGTSAPAAVSTVSATATGAGAGVGAIRTSTTTLPGLPASTARGGSVKDASSRFGSLPGGVVTSSAGVGVGAAAAASAATMAATAETPSAMPSAAPQERPASPEFGRFLTPHELESFGTPSPSGGGGGGGRTSSSSSLSLSRVPPFGGSAGEEAEQGASPGRGDRSSEEQSVSVSVSEERQEVGATTTEDSAAGTATAAGLGPTSGAAGGVGQATTSAVFSSNGGESTDASHQGGRDVMGGGGGSGVGGRGAGAGEPSASGGSTSSAHGDASGGSSSALMQQLGREADNSAGAAPLTSRLQQHQQHIVSTTSPAHRALSSAAVAAGTDTSSSGMARSSPASGMDGGVAQRQLPPPPPSTATVQLSPTAGGEASRDVGPMRPGRSIPGVNVDRSATLALRSLLMGAGGGSGTEAGAGSNSFWSGAGVTAGPVPRADAEGAGAGVARPIPQAATSSSSPARSTNIQASTSSSSTAACAVLAPGTGASAAAVAARPPSPPSPMTVTVSGTPSRPAADVTDISSLTTAHVSVTGSPTLRSSAGGATTTNAATRVVPLIDAVRGGEVRGGVASSAGLMSSTASPTMEAMEAGGRRDESVVSMPSSVVIDTGGSGGVSKPQAVVGGNGVNARSMGRGMFGSAAPVAVPAVSGESGVTGAGGRGSGMGGGMTSLDADELVEAVSARLSAEMAGSMSHLQEYVSQVVSARCRESVMEALSATEGSKASERATLVADISSAVDRTVRRGMGDTVATPLAKLVVNTARQVVADPIQASVSNLLSQQQRSGQAAAAAAHAGAQAGAQAAAQSQVSAIATATARAQAGAVRREVLECREELSRSVATSVQEPVGAAFRECFEVQLIPRIQAAVQRMFDQINESLTRGLQASPLVNNRAGALTKDVTHVRARVDELESGMKEVTAALTGLSEKMERLAELTLAVQQTAISTASAVEAQSEAQAAAAQAAGGAQAVRAWTVSTPPQKPTPPPPVTVDPREELHQLLVSGRLEEAMDKALSASDLPLVMWLCGRLDPTTIPALLPQHILLCLLQQLGASDLLEDTSTKLQWLQNCGLAVDPTEPKIRLHLPLVLGQLRTALTAAVPTVRERGGPDVGVIRMTAHVVNSLALTASTSVESGGGGRPAGGGGASGVQ